MNIQLFDYRNGKYQGYAQDKRPHGAGILIDDDLTLYLSHWRHGRLDGPTLLFLGRHKYIYGEWRGNQPHGLAVYRSGKNVLVGRYNKGCVSGRCVVIKEESGTARLLEKVREEWREGRGGALKGLEGLKEWLGQAQIDLPPHYYSLTKFICAFTTTTSAIKTFPMASGCCFAGFPTGLGLVFNSNNALLSVGYHVEQQLAEFGGRFNRRESEEGNFEAGGATVVYSSDRPSSQIYPIYHQLHQRSINFMNEYFDMSLKDFGDLDKMLKQKNSEQRQRSPYIGSATDRVETTDFSAYALSQYSTPASTTNAAYRENSEKYFFKNKRERQTTPTKALPSPRSMYSRSNPYTSGSSANGRYKPTTPQKSIPVACEEEPVTPRRTKPGLSPIRANCVYKEGKVVFGSQQEDSEPRAQPSPRKLNGFKTEELPPFPTRQQMLQARDYLESCAKASMSPAKVQLNKPIYRDIEERRTQILKQYQQLNSSPPHRVPHKFHENSPSPLPPTKPLEPTHAHNIPYSVRQHPHKPQRKAQQIIEKLAFHAPSEPAESPPVRPTTPTTVRTGRAKRRVYEYLGSDQAKQ